MNNIGLKIRNRRLELGLTQEELAHKIGYKTKGSINKLETTRDIPIKKLKPIADALGIDIKELMGWNDNLTEDNAHAVAKMLRSSEDSLLFNKIESLSEDEKKEVHRFVDFLISKKVSDKND